MRSAEQCAVRSFSGVQRALRSTFSVEPIPQQRQHRVRVLSEGQVIRPGKQSRKRRCQAADGGLAVTSARLGVVFRIGAAAFALGVGVPNAALAQV